MADLEEDVMVLPEYPPIEDDATIELGTAANNYVLTVRTTSYGAEQIRFFYGGPPDEITPVTIQNGKLMLNGIPAVPLPPRSSGWLAAVSPVMSPYSDDRPSSPVPPLLLVKGAEISADEEEWGMMEGGGGEGEDDHFFDSGDGETLTASDRTTCAPTSTNLPPQSNNKKYNFKTWTITSAIALLSVCIAYYISM